MRGILLAIGCAAAWLLAAPSVIAQQTDPAHPKVLAFFTQSGELDHFLFAQQAMRAFGAGAADGGYAFSATSDWDALNDANVRDVRVMIWLNDMPHTPAQRRAFERYRRRRRAARVPRLRVRQQRVALVHRVHGRWQVHRQRLASLPARVNADDPAHPICEELPASFVAPINECIVDAEPARPRVRCC
jgi:hypothetical protein